MGGGGGGGKLTDHVAVIIGNMGCWVSLGLFGGGGGGGSWEVELFGGGGGSFPCRPPQMKPCKQFAGSNVTMSFSSGTQYYKLHGSLTFLDRLIYRLQPIDKALNPSLAFILL